MPLARLKAKISDITMANGRLYAKIDKLEAGRPLTRRRSRTGSTPSRGEPRESCSTGSNRLILACIATATCEQFSDG